MAKRAEPASRARATIRPWWIAVTLFLAVVAVYARTATFEFVNFDDGLYVSSNPHVQTGLSLASIRWAFGAWNYIYWQPLTFVSHMADVSLYGVNHPGFHHVTNILLHAANAALLFLLLFRTTGALWRSAFAAALFALHPLRAESVAWIAERKDVLSGLFCILTLWTYHSWTRKRSPYWVWLLCGALGLMSKPMLVTLPFLLLLVDEWPLRRPEPLGRRIVEKLPLFAMALVVALVTYLGQVQYGATAALGHLSLATRLANAIVAYTEYLRKTCWPFNLAVLYPYRQNLSVVEVAVSAALIGTVSALAIWERRRRPYLFTGWFWFVGMLIPAIGIIQVGTQSMADRFSYLPSIGLAIAIVWLVSEPSKYSRLTAPAAAILLSALAVASWAQTAYWRDGVSLFQHAVEVTPDNAIAQHNLGFALAARGDNQAAIPHLREAVRLEPRYFQGHYNLGSSLLAVGNNGEALVCFTRAIAIKPDYAEAHYAHALALQALGRNAEAEAAWRTTLSFNLDPAFTAGAYNELGILLGEKGDVNGAIAAFNAALSLRPDLESAKKNLAMARSLRMR